MKLNNFLQHNCRPQTTVESSLRVNGLFNEWFLDCEMPILLMSIVMKYAFGDMPNSLKWLFAFKLFVAAIGEFSDRRAFNVPRKVHRKRLHQP